MTEVARRFDTHARQFARANGVPAGGVFASLRINHAHGYPVYMERGDGPYLFDTEGQRFIDLSLGNGAAILGHRHPALTGALETADHAGLSTVHTRAVFDDTLERLAAAAAADCVAG